MSMRYSETGTGKENAVDDIIDLEVLGREGDKLLAALKEGKLVCARSRDDFLYILEKEGEYHLFTHHLGAPEGGSKRFPVDEKYTAMMKSLATVADAVFGVTFDPAMDLFGVMASAEHGILSLFPGAEDDGNGVITFTVPGEDATQTEEGENANA